MFSALLATVLGMARMREIHSMSMGQISYEDELLKWRQQREEGLKRDGGWLTVAGLFWLKPGENSVGSAPDSSVLLPDRAPRQLGSLSVAGTKVSLVVRAGASATINGQAVTSQVLRDDNDDHPDLVRVGDLSFRIIKRGTRIGVRLYDPLRKTRKEFKGLLWFAPQKDYVVHAKYVPYAKPKSAMITNVLGDVTPVSIPGYAEFVLDGQTYRLDAQDEGDVLFFNFQDGTSGTMSYPAGRFLYSDKPKNGEVVLDFNRATSPPCAYTAFATCPLPPKGNRVAAPIRAGEQSFHPIE